MAVRRCLHRLDLLRRRPDVSGSAVIARLVTVAATNARPDPLADPGFGTILHGGATCLETDDGDTSYAEIFHSSTVSYIFTEGAVLFDVTDPLGGATSVTSADVVVVAKQLAVGGSGFGSVAAGFADSLGTVSAWTLFTAPSLTGGYATYRATLSRPPALADLRSGAVVGAAGWAASALTDSMAITYVGFELTVAGLAPLRQFPRNDGLVGTSVARQASTATSRQASIRQSGYQ